VFFKKCYRVVHHTLAIGCSRFDVRQENGGANSVPPFKSGIKRVEAKALVNF